MDNFSLDSEVKDHVMFAPPTSSHHMPENLKYTHCKYFGSAWGLKIERNLPDKIKMI